MHRTQSFVNVRRWMIVLLIVSPLSVAWAETPAIDQKKHLQTALRHALPGLQITHMSEQEIVPGWMQLDVKTQKGQKVVYADLTGRYVLVGSIFDLNTGQNLTRERLVKQREKIFDAFEGSMAIMVRPDASNTEPSSAQRPLLYFTDPDCPYCQQFQPEFQKLIDAGYRVAVLLFPSARLHPDASRKAASIWCAEDQLSALESAFRRDEVADPDASCPAPPLKEVRELAHAFGITGTPSLVLPDGEVIKGFQRAEGILTWLQRTTRLKGQPRSLQVRDEGRNMR
ncbi:MAG: hypothetical protein NPIRA01_34230 [Nitrospirales bacterium]|nr:MAG: hypothetical protein NPIRA01_34230 [Nitrospirales bacterium]